jgi:hypothetical protein
VLHHLVHALDTLFVIFIRELSHNYEQETRDEGQDIMRIGADRPEVWVNARYQTRNEGRENKQRELRKDGASLEGLKEAEIRERVEIARFAVANEGDTLEKAKPFHSGSSYSVVRFTDRIIPLVAPFSGGRVPVNTVLVAQIMRRMLEVVRMLSVLHGVL